VRTPTTTSLPSPAAHGVPQGSFLGPILFLLYVADLLKLIKRHRLSPHAYTDDTQIYGFCQPSDVNALADSVSACFDEVSSWMRANQLQVKPSQTEVLWCASGRRQHQIPTSPVHIGSIYVLPVSSVCDLGVHIDSDVSLRTHVTATIRSCFAALRQIWSDRCCLPQHALLTLIRALVVSKVDYRYCCSMLAGISGHLLDRLQSILNAAARLVFSARRSERITPLLCDLHWLRVPERIQFRLCVLAFRCLNRSAPLYLADSIHRTADEEGRRHLCSSTTMMLVASSVQRLTLADCAFPVAASRAWNSLPPAIQTVSSFTSFRQLKTYLFRLSFG